MFCPQCNECHDCHEKNRANRRGNCRRKKARKCPHRVIERVAPKSEGMPIKDNDPMDEEDVKHEWSSSAMTGPAQMDLKATQSQHYAQSTPLGMYQPPIWPQAPVFYQPPTAPSFFYRPPTVQPYQPFQIYPNMPSHSPLHTPFTWIPQLTPSAYGQYPLYPTYAVPRPFHHSLQSQQPQRYQNVQEGFYRKPKAQSKRPDPPEDPLSSKAESSGIQPEHAPSLKPGNQSTLRNTLKTSTAVEASELLAQREMETDAPTPQAESELRTLALDSLPQQEHTRSLEYVAHSPLEQHVQATQDAQSTLRTQPEPNLEVHGVGAENEKGQHVRAAQNAPGPQTTPNQGPQQWAQGGGATSSAAQPPSLSHNEPQAVSPQQHMQLETQPQYLAPVPQHVSLNAQPSVMPQTDPTPVSRPRTLSPMPVPQNPVSRSTADQDRDILGVSRFADQHKIRAAYWAREFEFHPARYRDSTPAIQVAMAKNLAKAQEAVDRLGGFSGIGWAVWEGLEEYSNHYESVVEGTNE